MTHEEQRIALAEWEGWKYSPSANSSIKHEAIMAWYSPGNSPWHLEQLPDYLNDLNAVHLLEKKLPKPKLPQDYWNVGYGRFKTILSNITSEPYSATAAQRCEALLKTLNLWKGGEA